MDVIPYAHVYAATWRVLSEPLLQPVFALGALWLAGRLIVNGLARWITNRNDESPLTEA